MTVFLSFRSSSRIPTSHQKGLLEALCGGGDGLPLGDAFTALLHHGHVLAAPEERLVLIERHVQALQCSRP